VSCQAGIQNRPAVFLFIIYRKYYVKLKFRRVLIIRVFASTAEDAISVVLMAKGGCGAMRPLLQ